MIGALLLEAGAIATSLNGPIIPDTLRGGTHIYYTSETHVNSLDIRKYRTLALRGQNLGCSHSYSSLELTVLKCLKLSQPGQLCKLS